MPITIAFLNGHDVSDLLLSTAYNLFQFYAINSAKSSVFSMAVPTICYIAFLNNSAESTESIIITVTL